MFCGQMYVKIIGSTQVTIQLYICINLVVHNPSFQNCLMKIGKECQKIGEIFCFGVTNFLL